MSIYTRTGDTGTTSLFGGKRVLKCEELVDAYGSIDELNSWVGLVTADSAISPEQKEFLQKIQSDLFNIGGSLAGWPVELAPIETRVAEMEVAIDVMEEKLPELKNFIIPSGSTGGARVHLARSVARRVERQVVALSQKQKVDLRIIKYLNRLSDLLFVLARTINKKSGASETIWSGIKIDKKK